MKSGPKPYGSDQEERDILERIVYLRKSNGKPRLTYQQIADQFNAEGIKTRSNKAWTLDLIYVFYRKYSGMILREQAGNL